MQATQGKINQDVAVMLERLSGRMDAAEARLKELEEQRRHESERREDRIETQPQNFRATIALALAAGGDILYLLWLVSQHWK